MAGTIPTTLRATARRYPDREAVVDGATRLTYAELDNAVLTACRAMMASGIGRGDRVAIWAQNCWQWVVAALGAQAAGAVVIPINTRFRGAEAAQILNRSRAVALFTTTGFLGADYPALLRDAACDVRVPIVVLDGIAGHGDVSWSVFVGRASSVIEESALARVVSVAPGDVSDVMFTSGTTGIPKGVVQTHENNLLAMGSFAEALELGQDDRALILAPLFAQFGLRAGLYANLIVGATTVLDSVFDTRRIIEVIEKEHITALPGPPTLFSALLSPEAKASDLSSLRMGLTGSTFIPADLIRRLRSESVFERVVTAYGLTEACGPVSVSRPEDDPETVATWAGKVMSHLEVRVFGDEIVVRGPTVMSGYLDDPEGTAEAIDKDGWLHTGDIGVVNEQGYVRITDRKKDMFIVGGFNVYPAEVEAMLLEFDGVGNVALVGVADERLGELGVAFVVPAPGVNLDVDELHDWCRARMANYKVPRSFRIVDALPLNASLKVDKPLLRKQAAEALTVGP